MESGGTGFHFGGNMPGNAGKEATGAEKAALPNADLLAEFHHGPHVPVPGEA